MNGDEQMLAAANDLRATISDLLEVHHADRIILTPGILVALRILFAQLGIDCTFYNASKCTGFDAVIAIDAFTDVVKASHLSFAG